MVNLQMVPVENTSHLQLLMCKTTTKTEIKGQVPHHLLSISAQQQLSYHIASYIVMEMNSCELLGIQQMHAFKLLFLLLDNPQKTPQYVSDTTATVRKYCVILKCISFVHSVLLTMITCNQWSIITASMYLFSWKLHFKPVKLRFFL